MRILHVDKFLPPTGGVAAVIDALAAEQRRDGHEVLQFGNVPPGGRDDMPRRHDFTRARPRDLPRMIHNRQAARLLTRFLATRRVNIAHLHNIYHHLTPSILGVLRRADIPAVMTVHDYRLACPTRHFYRSDGLCRRCLSGNLLHAASSRCAGAAGLGLAIESYAQRIARRYVRGIEHFLCPTRYMADVLRETGIPAGKLRIWPLPVPAPALPPVEPEGNRLLYAGRLSAEKGPDLMLDLAAGLPEARVTVLGEGPELAPLRAAVKARGLANVSLPGSTDRAGVARELARAAALVLPSRCMENAPVAMLEAMTAGRAVIVPDQPPLREFVRDGRTGRTFATGDADRLLAVAGQVLADAEARRTMAAAGQERIRPRHEPRAVAEATEAIYREAL